MNSATLDHPPAIQTAPEQMAAPAPGQFGFRAALPWLAIVLAAALATWRLWEPGALAGHSAWYDLTRMVVFDAAIRAGDWFPAWSPDFYHGYGSPLFQFYAPLTYYCAEIPVLAGADYATALKLTQALALAASGMAMYRFATPHLSRWAACFAAVLYMVAPYRFVDLYVRHALAEHCAFVWLPLIALGTERVVSERSRGGLLLGAMATAALILTHNIMALIGLPFCVAAGWALGARSRGFFPMLLGVAPAVFGIGLAAFFWWPALAGRALTHGPEALTQGYFDVQRNFVTLARLLSPTWGFGGSSEDAPNAMSVQIGAMHLIVVVGALLAALGWRAPRVRWIAVGATTMLLAVGMCHAISGPVWRALPLLGYVQFPWRFLGLAVFGGAMCGGAVVDRIAALSPRREVAVFVAGLIAVMAAYFPYCREAWFLAMDTRSHDPVRLRAELLKAGLATGRLIPVGGALTPETLRRSGERGTAVDEFLPRGVAEKPAAPPTEHIAVSAGWVVNVTQPAPNHYRAEVSLPEPGTVELRQFWFPGWSATGNGRPLEVAPSDPSALVTCALAGGEHVVEFRYRSLPQRRSGFIVSLFACATLFKVARTCSPRRASAARWQAPRVARA